MAVPRDRDAQPVPRCGAVTADRSALAEGLRQCPSEPGVMESTGVSWMALVAGLAERGCDVKLVDAHDARHMPGRQTDVEACQGLQALHTYGFLHGALRPADQVCGLRSFLRPRPRLVAMASRAIQPREGRR